jgi:N-acetylmuramoyl-L-alanine amidase
MRKINAIIIHCSATPADRDYTVANLERDHKARGFKAIGYHRYIKKDGTVYVGRPYEQIGAHVGDLGRNSDTIGICYEGGIKAGTDPRNFRNAADTRTDEQKAAILNEILLVIEYLKSQGQDVSKLEIMGHRDLSPDKNGNGIIEPHEWVKVCPCFDAKKEYNWITV